MKIKMTAYLQRMATSGRWAASLRMGNNGTTYDIHPGSWGDLVAAAATLSTIIGAEVHLIKEGGRYARAIVVGRDDVAVVIDRG